MSLRRWNGGQHTEKKLFQLKEGMWKGGGARVCRLHVHVLFQGTGLKKGSSIQPRKGPEYHHMKFRHYPMMLRETPSKRGSTVIGFSVQKYLSGCGRLAFKASRALATPHISYFTWLCLCPSHCTPPSLVLFHSLQRPCSFLLLSLWRHSTSSVNSTAHSLCAKWFSTSLFIASSFPLLGFSLNVTSKRPSQISLP